MDINNPTSSQGFAQTGPPRLTFSVTTSLQDELDAFIRYSRLGLFQRAQEVYGDVLDGPYETLFPVTAELADSLLEQGNFRHLFTFLEDRLRRATQLSFKGNEVGLLRLLKALADFHRYGDLRGTLEVARSWRKAAEISMTPETLSTIDVS